MIVDIEGLRKSFAGHRVLDGLDLAVEEGAIVALLGPNGSGKTTTVRVLTTLTRPDAGRVVVAGHDVLRDPRAVRQVVSLTGQSVAVDDRQTARENLVLLGRLAHLGRTTARRRADELLDRFALAEVADRRVGTWSGGMRRRLDLAMSLISAPRLIVLDEPTTGLDPAGRGEVWTAVSELAAAGTTVLLTTQYLEEADRLSDRIVLIDAGRVIAEGTAEALKHRVGGARIDLRLVDPDDVPRAAALLGDAVRHTDGVLVQLASDGSADHLRTVLDQLHLGGVPVAQVASARPTLDDVFLTLTARSAPVAA